MVRYSVTGGRPLYGEIEIGGAKNAAVAIIPAAVLVNGICRIENIPQVSDVTLMLEILQEMGAKIRMLTKTTIEIDTRNVHNARAPYELVRRMRASYYLIGSLLARFGHAQVALPGGCDFGVRPIDQHIKGFEALGATVKTVSGFVNADSPGRLTGSHIYLDVVSVGATINIMLAATLADSLTVIENAAREPHIVDLANFLNSMGADIKGAGTNVIKIRGKERISGGTYTIIPDQIEAGTYMAAVAACGGKVTLRNVIPKHLDCISAKLLEMNVDIIEYDDAITIERTEPLRATNVKTLPYPGFPTDMQPQIATCLCLAKGTSVITEGVWDNRFRYVDELKRMGAKITVNGKVAVVESIPSFSGAPILACDLRAGAALVVAALSAEGVSEIDGIHHIERGYEDIVSKLNNVGAMIKRVEIVEPDLMPAAL